MNYGRYFSLDVNASQLVKGIAVYNYRGVKNRSVKITNDNRREKYPIYVTFSQEGVSFHIHNIEENTSEDQTTQHTNSLILSLPISLNLDIKDSLTQNVINIFHNKFPYNSTENRLYDYAASSLKNSELEGKGITYSSLEVFGIVYDKSQEIERPPIVGMLRKLFLDFLYDIEHTNVFKNAYNSEAIYIALNENFLFKAIRNKAEYYYQRKMVSVPRDGYETAFDVAEKEIFMADSYVDAEKRWVETIADPRSESTFHIAEGWFLSAEKEMNAVYKSDILSFYKKGKSVEPTSYYKTFRCADFVKRIKYSKSEETVGIEYNKKCLEDFKGTIVDTAKRASKWYIHKYSFSGTLRIWYGKSYLAKTIIFVTAIVVLLLSIAVPSWIGLSNSDLTLPIGTVLFLSLWRIISLCSDRLKQVGSISLLMPRLFAAITTAWFTLAIGEDVFKGFFDTTYSFVTSGALLLITFFFVAYEIEKINPYISRPGIIGRSLALIGVAFIYSFIAGLLVVHFFGSKYLERSDYMDEFYANKVFTEKPDYLIIQDSIQPYVHKHFYGVIAKYDSMLLSSINRIKIGSVQIGNPDIEKYLTVSYSVNVNDSLHDIEYGVTAKLLSIFNAKDSLLTHSDKVTELYQHMIEGSLLSHRIAKVKSFVNSLKVEDSLFISSQDLNMFNIVIDSTDAAKFVDKSWIEMLKSIDNQTVYRETLKYLSPVADSHKSQTVISEYAGINIFRELLFQFTFFAMFIGIFLQLIFEEKLREKFN